MLGTNAELIEESKKHKAHKWPKAQRDEKPYCDYCSTAWPCLASRLSDALEAAEAERVRLVGIINEARNFDGMQTVNGVTDEGWMSPDEWLLGKIDEILSGAEDGAHHEAD